MCSKASRRKPLLSNGTRKFLLHSPLFSFAPAHSLRSDSEGLWVKITVAIEQSEPYVGHGHNERGSLVQRF